MKPGRKTPHGPTVRVRVPAKYADRVKISIDRWAKIESIPVSELEPCIVHDEPTPEGSPCGCTEEER